MIGGMVSKVSRLTTYMPPQSAAARSGQARSPGLAIREDILSAHLTLDAAMVLGTKLLTELVGTFVFFTVIALAGPIGPLAPLAIGFMLMAMVYMGGHISGAHYNPAVTFAVFLRRKIGVTELLGYWAVQLVAAALAFTFGYLVSGKSGGIHPGAHVYWLSALAVEAATAS